MPNPAPLDLIIVGGGIGGVISLHCARQAGLNALLFEKADVVGGLWAQLPAWQDVQLHPHDWTLGDLPIGGPEAASIARNIRAWVDRFELAPFIRLGTPVTRATETAEGWEVATPGQTHRARHLIAATGCHNRPVVPPTERVGSTVQEFHSSALADPALLSRQGRRGGRRWRVGVRPAGPVHRTRRAPHRLGLPLGEVDDAHAQAQAHRR